jgi:DNA repair protein RecN (Recombination protein N)
LRDLCRKYGDDLAEVMRYHREVADRVAEIEGYEARAARLDVARRDALDALARAAAAVGAARREAAPRLAEAVTSRLADLAMPHATVDVDVPQSGPGDDGSHVTFLLSANPGSPLLPLTKVASGGELARTMLALRLVMIGLDDGGEAPSTLIFDEVDAGIGGTAATAVGAALAKVGTTHQVLVVTHLAQVAAQATTQVTVTKRIVDGGTDVEAVAVSGEQRVEEVARMLSGDLSERGGSAAAAARRHAAELLAK